MLISQSEIDRAVERIAPYVDNTPLIQSYYFSKLLEANIYFKLETYHPVHTFKVRGATNAVLALSEEQQKRGIVTASGGNHGLGLALIASRLGIPAKIYLAKSTAKSKIDALNDLGAEVILFGDAWDEANQEAMRLADVEGLNYVHPFNNLHVMAGQATIATELLQQLPQIDMIIASIGGGGLISGIASGIQAQSPTTRLIGVETIGADSMAQSIQNGQITQLDAITSVAGSLGAKKTEKAQFEIVQTYVEDVVTVSDKQAIETLWDILNHEKMLVEPAASCSLSALINGKIHYNKGDNIVIIVCGANTSIEEVLIWREQFGLT